MAISTPMKRILTATLLGAMSLAAWGQSDTRPAIPMETPDLPPPGYAGETVQPDVTILETDRGTVYEYRINGQLYMVRIQPQMVIEGCGSVAARASIIRVLCMTYSL